MLHLKKLSGAGLTHVHLLPSFQFAGVHDEKDKWMYVGKVFLSRKLILHYCNNWTS